MKLKHIQAAMEKAREVLQKGDTFVHIVENFPDKKHTRQMRSRELRKASIELSHLLGEMRHKE